MRPYQFHLQWVFDDAGYNLDGEPLILGVDQLCDKLQADYGDGCAEPPLSPPAGETGAE